MAPPKIEAIGIKLMVDKSRHNDHLGHIMISLLVVI